MVSFLASVASSDVLAISGKAAKHITTDITMCLSFYKVLMNAMIDIEAHIASYSESTIQGIVRSLYSSSMLKGKDHRQRLEQFVKTSARKTGLKLAIEN